MVLCWSRPRKTLKRKAAGSSFDGRRLACGATVMPLASKGRVPLFSFDATAEVGSLTVPISSGVEGAADNVSLYRDQPEPPAEVCRGDSPGFTHHNSDTGSYGKFRIPSKPRLLPYSFATFR